MLKRQDYVYENEFYKIINPTRDIIENIYKKIDEYTDENNELNINDVEFVLYLLQELVVSENEDYQFDLYNVDNIKEISENPPSEYKNIIYYIGNIVSDIIIEKFQLSILQIKQSHIDLLKSEIINRTAEFKKDVEFVERNKRRIDAERNASSKAKEFVDDIKNK